MEPEASNLRAAAASLDSSATKATRRFLRSFCIHALAEGGVRLAVLCGNLTCQEKREKEGARGWLGRGEGESSHQQYKIVNTREVFAECVSRESRGQKK